MRIRSIFISLFLLLGPSALFAQSAYNVADDSSLADGTPFDSWEEKTVYKKVYYVDQANPLASDTNSGSEEKPFKTISAAAKILKAGEKVIIKKGIYREQVIPERGGESPRKMIAYEAADDSVIICGSVELPSQLFEKSRGWHFPSSNGEPLNVWQIDLLPEWFQGYNPFGMANILHDLAWLDYKRAKMDSYFKRRGMLFVNGKLATQVAKPELLSAAGEFAYWIEHNGLRLHINLPHDSKPADFMWEATNKEQVFAPRSYGLGYIKIKGIIFRHAGNGFPVPQRGLVSASRGHHWIVEDCTIEWANSVGLDMGNECWSTEVQPVLAHHIVRRNIIRNCGISGFQCYMAKHMLVEDNVFHNIGWQDAEHAFESGGVKFHQAENCLIRRNVFSDIVHAPGLWLDYQSNKNCRITSNLFADITTARGAIYIEVSRNDCSVDHNFIYKTRCQWWLSGEYGAGGSGFYTDGSDSIRFHNNLVIDAENTGYGSYLNAERIVDMRGGITCDHELGHNLFVDCKKHAVEFPNTRNKSDYNIYVNPRPGYIKLGNPAPALLLDIEAVTKLYGWDQHSVVYKKMTYDYDEERKELRVNLTEPLPFKAGPFTLKKGENVLNVDPRRL